MRAPTIARALFVSQWQAQSAASPPRKIALADKAKLSATVDACRSLIRDRFDDDDHHAIYSIAAEYLTEAEAGLVVSGYVCSPTPRARCSRTDPSAAGDGD